MSENTLVCAGFFDVICQGIADAAAATELHSFYDINALFTPLTFYLSNNFTVNGVNIGAFLRQMFYSLISLCLSTIVISLVKALTIYWPTIILTSLEFPFPSFSKSNGKNNAKKLTSYFIFLGIFLSSTKILSKLFALDEVRQEVDSARVTGAQLFPIRVFSNDLERYSTLGCDRVIFRTDMGIVSCLDKIWCNEELDRRFNNYEQDVFQGSSIGSAKGYFITVDTDVPRLQLDNGGTSKRHVVIKSTLKNQTLDYRWNSVGGYNRYSASCISDQNIQITNATVNALINQGCKRIIYKSDSSRADIQYDPQTKGNIITQFGILDFTLKAGDSLPEIFIATDNIFDDTPKFLQIISCIGDIPTKFLASSNTNGGSSYLVIIKFIAPSYRIIIIAIILIVITIILKFFTPLRYFTSPGYKTSLDEGNGKKFFEHILQLCAFEIGSYSLGRSIKTFDGVPLIKASLAKTKLLEREILHVGFEVEGYEISEDKAESEGLYQEGNINAVLYYGH
ncbi:hypothetical protein HK096_001541 [Nowakowskiella sp. JEL0078]|nr:hypothetical protein HK096_001541 [Nowakowskiella sp. JEL0078]